MGARGWIVSALCGALLLGMPPTDAAGSGPTVGVIVVLHEDATDVRGIARGLAARHGGEISDTYLHALTGFAGRFPEAAVRALRRHPAVASVEEDSLVTIAGQVVPDGVRRVHAPANTTIPIGRSAEEAVDADIAVIDTGIDDTHPSLAVVSSVNCRVSGCPAGGRDDNGHGTHVAGTAAARDDGQGVVGVAPGARLWSVKVLDARGAGMLSQVVRGVDWVAQNAATIEVANLSLSANLSSSLNQAVEGAVDAGVVVVAAAGNSGVDAAATSPANHPDVIGVAAIADYDGASGGLVDPACPGGRTAGADDTLATFSNFGAVIDMAAPGVCVRSTAPGGGTALMNGTSMAAPHVAGAAALLASGAQAPVDRTGVEQLREALLGAGEADWDVTDPSPHAMPLLDVSDDTVFSAATTPVTIPVVSLQAPSDGSVLTGTVTLSVTADPSADIARVDFLVDDVAVGASTATPHTLDWDTAMVPDGTWTVRARARTTGGVHALSAERDVLVVNTGPQVQVSAPTAETPVAGIVEVVASASDVSGVEEVRVEVDGEALALGVSPLRVAWDTRSAQDGPRNLAVHARNGAGLISSAAVEVTVDNTAPVVALTTPASDEMIRGSTTLSASATDAGGVAEVVFLVDGEEVGGRTAAPYEVHWDSSALADGMVSLTATATDHAGNTATSAPVTVRLRNATAIGQRLAGADRWATAARVSQATFEPGVARVYVATGLDFPDALAAGGVAAAGSAPLLLTAPSALPSATAAELARLQPQEIVVVGGTAAVSAAVAHTLSGYGAVRRVQGSDRFATAAELSAESHPDGAPVVLVASGSGFADALAGGPAAAAMGGPLLLVTRDTVPAATEEALRRLGPARIVVLGGTGAVGDDVVAQLRSVTSAEVTRLRGSDRFATGAAVSATTHPDGTDTVFLATGTGYADALAGAPAAAALGAPILLVGGEVLPSSVAVELGRLQARDVIVLGGRAVISQARLDAAVAASS